MRNALLILISAGLAYGSATDFWITQSGAGSANGSTLANAASCGGSGASTCTAFNAAANWGAGAAQIGAGTTIHLSGTFTAAQGACHYLQFQAGGNVGVPITLHFETGAVLTATAWCNNSQDGPLNLNGMSNIVIDGGTNGIIQATNNGTAGSTKCITSPCAQLIGQGDFIGGLGGTSNNEIKNLTLQDLYVHDPAVNNNDIFAPHDQNSGIVFWPNGGATNLHIHNNHLTYISWALNGWGNNIEIDHNDLGQVDHCIAFGPSANTSGMFFHDNHCHDNSVWDSTSGQYHHDGIHIFQNGTNTTTNWYIYNNIFDGAWGVNITGPFFTEGNVNHFWMFNNFLTFSDTTNDGTGMFAYSPNAAAVISDIFVANNTWIGNANGLCMHFYTAVPNVTFVNNAVTTCQTLVEFDSTSNTFTATGMDRNVYLNVGNPIFHYGSSTTNALTGAGGWQSLTGADANAKIDTAANIKLTATGHPQSGSILVSAAANLFSTCNGQPIPGLGALCSDGAGVARPSSGAWDVGAFQLAGPPPTVAPVTMGPFTAGQTGIAVTLTGSGFASGSTVTWSTIP